MHPIARFLALPAALICLSPLPARAEAVARLGEASFDARRSVISVPYEGPAPKGTLFKLSPTHYYYELEPARLGLGNVQFQALGGAIQRFTLANRPSPNVVRLSFQLSVAATPAWRIDAAHHRLVVMPLGHEAPLPFAHEGAPQGWKLPRNAPAGLSLPQPAAELGKPFLAGRPSRFVLPFKGPQPQFVSTTFQRNPRWIVMDVYGADWHSAIAKTGSFEDPLFEAWMLSRRPEPHHTRMYLRLRHITPVTASLAPGRHEIWLTAGPLPAGSATPAPHANPEPTPEPVTTPGAASPAPSPPHPATPEPTATPLPMATPAPAGTPSPIATPGPIQTPAMRLVPSPMPSPVAASPAAFVVPAGRSLPIEGAPSQPPLLVPRPDSGK